MSIGATSHAVARSPSFGKVQKQLGKRIRAARVEAELPQEQAAAEAGIDYKRWQKLEAGDVNVTIQTIYRVAEALGLSFWELLGSQDD